MTLDDIMHEHDIPNIPRKEEIGILYNKCQIKKLEGEYSELDKDVKESNYSVKVSNSRIDELIEYLQKIEEEVNK